MPSTPKAVGHGRSGVTACGHKHVDRASGSRLPMKYLSRRAHETGADIFECECGAVEKFETVDAVLHFGYRAVKARVSQTIRSRSSHRNVFTEKRFGHTARLSHETRAGQSCQKILLEGV